MKAICLSGIFQDVTTYVVLDDMTLLQECEAVEKEIIEKTKSSLGQVQEEETNDHQLAQVQGLLNIGIFLN